MATHKNLKASVRALTRAIATVRNDDGDGTERQRRWLRVVWRIDAVEDRAREEYGEDMSKECVALRTALAAARDSATEWRIGRLAHEAGRVAPVRELSPLEASYHAEIRAAR